MNKAGEPTPKRQKNPVRQGLPQAAKSALPQKLHQRACQIDGGNGTERMEKQPGGINKLSGLENRLPYRAQQLVFMEQIHTEGQGGKVVDMPVAAGLCAKEGEKQLQRCHIYKQHIVGKQVGLFQKCVILHPLPPEIGGGIPKKSQGDQDNKAHQMPAEAAVAAVAVETDVPSSEIEDEKAGKGAVREVDFKKSGQQEIDSQQDPYGGQKLCAAGAFDKNI